MATQRKFTVTGRITNTENQLLPGLKVQAFNRPPDSRNEAPLGDPTYTDAGGKYIIEFPVTALPGSEEEAHLLIRVYSETDELLGESPVQQTDRRRTKIDLAVPYDREPEPDYRFLFQLNLANSTPRDIEALSPAEQRAVATVLNRELNQTFLRLVGPQRATLAGVLRSAAIEYSAGTELSLVAYFDRFIGPEAQQAGIPEEDITRMRQAISRTRQQRVAGTLGLETSFRDHPAFGVAFRRAQATEFARISGLAPVQIGRLTTADLSWDQITETSLLPLVVDGTLSEADRDSLLVLSDLARLTGNNLPLIEALKTPELSSVAELVHWDQAAWADFLQDNDIPLPAGEASLKTYAERLRRNLERSFPTAYFLAHSDLSPNTSRFLENNFVDLQRTDFAAGIESFDWTGITEADRPAVQRELMAYQRIQVLTEDTSTSRQLLTRELDSALAIAKIPLSTFIEKSALPRTTARTIYQRAQQQVAATTHFAEAVRSAAFGTFAQLKVSNQLPVAGPLLEVDGLDQLFGSQNYCACEHCRSILSPAAYFTDLMYFVQQNIAAQLPADHAIQLRQRRPDLWTLPLTCANTTTEIPYLQVVNEVLEAYIAANESTEDVYALLDESHTTVTLPVDMRLEELRTYLSHFLPLHELYRTLGLERSALRRERLRLSDREVGLIATANTDQAWRRFGNLDLTEVPVPAFLRYARIDRAELSALFATRFSAPIGSLEVQIIAGTEDIQQYTEVITGLTPEHLDLIHRYLRLWKQTGWSLPEFDLLLVSLEGADLLDDLADTDADGTPRFLILADLLEVQEELRCTVEELAALVHEIPQTALTAEQQSLLERQFDLENLFGPAEEEAEWPYATSVLLPADAGEDRTTPLLLAGLGIQESELTALLRQLGFDLDADITLDYPLLSRLFRQVRVARGLGWSVNQLLAAQRMVLADTPLTEFGQIMPLIEFNDWLQSAPFQPEDLLFILYGTETGARRFTNDAAASAAVIADLQADHAVDKRELLLQYLQRTFPLAAVRVHEAQPLPLVRTDLNAGFDDAGQPIDPDNFIDLTPILREFERLQLLYEQLGFGVADISFLVTNPAVFGIDDLPDLDLSGIMAADRYRQLLSDGEAPEPLRDSLLQYAMDGVFTEETLARLAGIWPYAPDLLRSLADSFFFAPTALPAIRSLRIRAELADTLDLEGHNLARLTGSGYAELAPARDAALAAFVAKYPEESVRRETLEPYTDQINTRKRDALCDYIIGRGEPWAFRDRAELYAYFLLDVEMSGCFRTSRIVAAISSLQLYVHRVLVNLEQTPAAVEPQLSALSAIPDLRSFQQEWEWRKNYRVWEANRKVFLYPENWIYPELRDGKTPLFEELEHELLQEEITQQSAEAAYRHYLAQFSDLARLRYAGAYFHRQACDDRFLDLGLQNRDGYYYMVTAFGFGTTRQGTYYLFARTHTDPYQYYYRTFNPTTRHWGHWTKMELAIEAEEISALIYNGRLYVFWTEVHRKEVVKLSGGETKSDDVIFKVFTKYSFLKEPNTWSPPQRLSAGYLPTEEPWIFARALDEGPSDKKRDFAFEEFERQVFRKPYARLAPNDKTSPIDLSYIWTQRRELREVTYRLPAGEHPLKIKEQYVFDTFTKKHVEVFIQVPRVDFSFVEGYFEPQQRRTEAILIARVGSDEIESVTTTVEIILGEDPSSCTIYVEEDITPYPDRRAIEVDKPIEVTVNKIPQVGSIEVTHYDLSLARNTFAPNQNSDITARSVDINVASARFLTKEYETTAAENGVFARYVENGSKTFTSSRRKIIQTPHGDAHLSTQGNGNALDTEPLSTFLTDELTDIIHTQGLTAFLSLQTQTLTDTAGRQFDLNGPYGAYYWELFFHIPFLIANHLNANQQFKEAKWWYERIFNPTSEEPPSDTYPADHNWRFRAFRRLGTAKLKNILTDSAAIAVYQEDPFNPHAIARLRTSAYQKAVVMKYIDNLLDWGDELFAQDTREAIQEAAMLYQLAKDILGDRPSQVGACETVGEETRTYESIEPLVAAGAGFLIGLENRKIIDERAYEDLVRPLEQSKFLRANLYNMQLRTPPDRLTDVADSVDTTAAAPLVVDENESTPDLSSIGTLTQSAGLRVGRYTDLVNEGAMNTPPSESWTDFDEHQESDFSDCSTTPGPAIQVITEGMLVYCVPHNAELRAYWDRVEDRLFKIRHCMNISGVRRSLALFQPPIDPGLLVRAKALGLSIEEIIELATIPAAVPHHRFEYLIDKARQYTQTVQAFGNALQSAMERKDGEELALLRSVHEQNTLTRIREIKERQVKEAYYQLQAQQAIIKNIENRITHYDSLISEGFTPLEHTQLWSKHAGNSLLPTSALMQQLSSRLDVGPKVLGFSFSTSFWSGASALAKTGFVFDLLSKAAHGISDSFGFHASFERRVQEWNLQLTLARQELEQVNQQLLAAEIRHSIAEKDLINHQKSIEQLEEVHQFYEEKFTNLELYQFLSSNLNRLYREAYKMALNMVRQAEQAYRYERDVPNELTLLGSDHFDLPRAGLLAGERLLVELQSLEHRFLETHERIPEIDQSFSLLQMDPSAFLNLKQTGSCNFEISEFNFDLYYPGHYRRKIRSVRLTIPCVSGPYVNVSATLNLIGSQVRLTALDEDLTELPLSRNNSIATSRAQNDAGVFQLNFRDERYLPFEGAGAISSWKLSLPKNFRSFDYDTISDVIIHISYTAYHDDRLRIQVEGDNAEAESTLLALLRNNSMYRIFSLKHDFSSGFHRLLSRTSDETVNIEITNKHFPFFFSNREIEVIRSVLILDTPADQSVDNFEIQINGTSQSGFIRDPDFGNLWVKDIGDPFSTDIKGIHTISIVNGGDLALAGPDSPAIDKKKLKEITLYVEYQLR